MSPIRRRGSLLYGKQEQVDRWKESGNLTEIE